MEYLHFTLTFFGFVLLRCSDCTDITFSIMPQVTMENNSVSFKCCAGYDADILAFVRTKSPLNKIVFSVFTAGRCTIQLGLGPEFADQCTCDYQRRIIECLVSTISRSDNGYWQCVDIFTNTSSTFVDLSVTVPIQEACIPSDVQNVVTINDTKQLSLKCKAPNGIPAANISWFLDNKTPNQSNDDIDITEFSAVTIQSYEGTTTVESTLSYNVSAYHNGMLLYCTANNTADDHLFSRLIHLNIRYNPEQLVFVNNQTNDTVFYLIRNSNTNQSLQCQVKGGNPLATLKWSCYDGIQSDENSQSSAISTVTWIAADLTDSTCSCSASHILGWEDRRVVYIHVFYEPTLPTCTLGNANLTKGFLNLTLNSNDTIYCKSEGNPPPERFTWTWPTGHTSEGITLSLNNVSHAGLYILSVENMMTPSIGKIVNGRSNTSFNINIQYGPRNTSFFGGQSEKIIISRTISVIKNKEISITAFADARPPPSYQWWNNQVGATISQEFRNDVNISCSIANVLYPTGFNSIQQQITRVLHFEVLYEPTLPMCTLGNANVTKGVLNLTLNSNVNITCKSEGKPSPENFTWTWPTSLKSEGKTLSLIKVQTTHDGLYILTVENMMTPSIGEIVKGRSNTSFNINIQYPPNITNAETKLVAIKGTNFSIYCNVTPGNPTETFFTWKRETNRTAEQGGQLIEFPNISKIDEGNLTCVARNKMTPSCCAEEDGVDKHHFYVDVQYKATITRFAASTATVKHTEELSFECDIDSDPPANVSIVSPNGTQLHSTRGEYQLRYRKTSSCLEDNGNFTCISANKHNCGSPALSIAKVEVKCLPMYRTYYTPVKLIKSMIGEKAVMKVEVFSYPSPYNITWTNVSNSLQLRRSDRINITTSDDKLSSEVSIMIWGPWDFSNYSVTVQNDVGNMTETFCIILDGTLPATTGPLQDTNNIGAVVGGSVGAITVVAVIAVVVIVILYRRIKGFEGTPQHDNNTLQLIEDTRHESEKIEKKKCDHVLPINDETSMFEDEKHIYGNIQPADGIGKSLTIKTIRDTVGQLKVDPVPLFKEFYTLQMGLKYDTKDALKPNNVAKNRYRSVYPYDASRVALPFLRGDPDSDFINASYIDGYCKPKKYIAAQGPLENTISDTWRMIYSEDIKTIIMVTNLIESGKRKCFQYWPDDRATYGKCNVKLDKVEEYADFVVRHFTYSMEGTRFERKLIQFHYTSWPDKNVPATALSLVQFWRKVRQSQFVENTPWMVHCSAGVGRTGTFIALDYLFDQGKVDGKLNVTETVNVLREQRISMVQTKEQYLYLHEAITELLDPVGQIFTPENILGLQSTVTEDETLNKQFKAITNSIVKVKTEENDYELNRMPDGQLPGNMCKSIDTNVIPDDMYRPPLLSTGNDFINAVYIPTYRESEKYIVTQFPLQNTVADFVRLLWDHNIRDVVLLDNEDDKQHCYWPHNKNPLCLGPFVVSPLSVDETNICTSRKVDISFAGKLQSKQTMVHQFTAWPGYLNLCEPKILTEFLQTISRIAGPVVIQCHDGYSRSGLFAALLCIVDRIKTDNEVAIADTVRVVKHRRQAAIIDMEQYQFCHEVVFEYLKGREAHTEEKENQEYVNMTFPKFL